MYELNATRNVLTLMDKLSGGELEFYHRLPTNDERVAYDNAMTKRKGAKVVVSRDYQITQAKYGARLLTGFKKGDFAVDGKAISSDQADPDFYPQWKNLLFRKRPDLLAHVARTIMSSVAQAELGIDFEDPDQVIEDLMSELLDAADDDGTSSGTTDAAATTGATAQEPVADPLSAQ